MTQNRRLVNLLAAGTLMGLVAVTVFLFDSNHLSRVIAAQITMLRASVSDSASDAVGATIAGGVAAANPTQLQTENDALRATIQTMQAREAEFQARIEKANTTLKQFESSTSSQVAEANTAASALTQHNQELQQTLQLLQERESQFRNQIASANDSIRSLENVVQQRQLAIQTLQTQNAELVKAVQVLQAREQQYQAQLQAATQALQNGGNTQANSGNSSYEAHEEHDDDD